MADPYQSVGSLLGIKILVGAGDTTSSRSQREAAFRTATARYTLESMCVVAAAATAARTDRERWEQATRRAGINPIVNLRPYLLRRTVTRATAERALPDAATDIMTFEELIAAEQALLNLVDVNDYGSSAGISPLYMAMRSYQSQYHDQLDSEYFVRELALVLRTIDRLRDRGEFDIDQEFYRQNGITFRDFCFLSFAFLAMSAAHPGKIYEPSEPELAPPLAISEEAVERYKALVSIDFPSFKLMADKHPFHDFPSYSLSPLLMWPLIDLGGGRRVAPIATDILDRVVRAVFYDNLSCLTPQQFERFLLVYGDIYQDYVGETLSARYPGAVHTASDEIAAVKGRKVCDFIVDCQHFGLLLIEVKSGRLGARAELLKLPNELRTAFAKDGSGAAKGASQLHDTARSIREGRSRWKQNSLLSGLLVLSGELVLMNTREIHGIIDDIVEESVNHDQRIPYQIANDLDFERLVRAHADSKELGRYLRLKMNSGLRSQRDFAIDLAPPDDAHPLQDAYSSQFRELMSAYGADLPPTSNN